MRKLIFFLFFLAFSNTVMCAQQYDLVLEGGRVMDPETGLDACAQRRHPRRKDRPHLVRGAERTPGVHAGGLVVAPGFIDLHQHGQEIASQRVKALDGVTTALELEIGVPDVAQFLKAKEGRSLIHYGTSASHVAARALVFGRRCRPETSCPRADPRPISPPRLNKSTKCGNACAQELDAGGLAIGMGIQYTPGATRLEVIDMFRLAAERRLPVYTHVRSNGSRRARLLH
jgi:hypothetical protein